MTALDHALDLHRRGLCVIPVPRPDHHDGKRPVISWRDYQKRRPTEDEIRAWFQVDHNIAVITGAVSGVIVIDIDSPEALTWIRRRLPWTPWQTRTARGYHLWYGHPGRLVRNRARLETGEGRLAIDVRGDGGFVVGPGSVHASGARYEQAGDWSVTRNRLPRFWVGWVQRRARPSPPRTRPRPTGDIVGRARRYLAAIPKPEIGAGSDEATLYAAARVALGFHVPEPDAVSLIWEWAGGRPGWTREWIAKKVRNATLYGTEPVGALR